MKNRLEKLIFVVISVLIFGVIGCLECIKLPIENEIEDQVAEETVNNNGEEETKDGEETSNKAENEIKEETKYSNEELEAVSPYIKAGLANYITEFERAYQRFIEELTNSLEAPLNTNEVNPINSSPPESVISTTATEPVSNENSNPPISGPVPEIEENDNGNDATEVEENDNGNGETVESEEPATEPVVACQHTQTKTIYEFIPATCTENGSNAEVVYCSMCVKELSRVTVTIPATGHTPGDPVEEQIENERYMVTRCTVCNEILEKSIVLACNHLNTTTKRENEVEATCTAAGSYDLVVCCTVCGEELSREAKTIPKIAHTPAEAVEENRFAPTCKKTGSYEEVIYCAVCKEELSRKRVIEPPAGHTQGDPVEEQIENERYMVTYCTVCGKMLNRKKITNTSENGGEPVPEIEEHDNGNGNGETVESEEPSQVNDEPSAEPEPEEAPVEVEEPEPDEDTVEGNETATEPAEYGIEEETPI